MTFPNITPTSRTFEAGDYPVKTYRAQSGKEFRILYGTNRTEMKLSLAYENIKDSDAEMFLDHYDEMKGTFKTFEIASESLSGWGGNDDALETGSSAYRYAEAPQQTQVRPGISTVTVNLIGVL